jgi:CBS domain-containing protein
MTVGDMMTKDLITCSPDETLAQAAQKMASGDIGCCPVVENGQLVGVITDRDITVRAVARGLDPNSQHVREMMSTNLVTVTPDTSVEDACRLMMDYQVRRLPVVEGNRLVGMVSLADLAIDLEEEEMVAEVVEKVSMPAR